MEVGLRRETCSKRGLSVCSEVSADRSGRAVRDLQPWRLSVCSDVSVVGQYREGAAAMEVERLHARAPRQPLGSVAPPYLSRSISVESSGQSSVMIPPQQAPPASHGFRWLGRPTLRSVSADRSGSAVKICSVRG